MILTGPIRLQVMNSMYIFGCESQKARLIGMTQLKPCTAYP